MELEVLVAAVNKNAQDLIKKMNIATNIIIGNQCGHDNCCEFIFNTNKVKVIESRGRGVGENRNRILMESSADICIFADDDMRFVNGYNNIVRKAFNEIPDADAIIFNIITENSNRRTIRKIARIHMWNAFNYGTARLSIKNSSIKRENIMFSRIFGGGTIYSSGEDSIFILDMLKKNLKIYTYPEVIAEVDDSKSTWFHGFDDKYFYDKGALFKAMFGRTYFLLCILFIFKHLKFLSKKNLSIRKALMLMKMGANGYKLLRPYVGNDDLKN